MQRSRDCGGGGCVAARGAVWRPRDAAHKALAQPMGDAAAFDAPAVAAQAVVAASARNEAVAAIQSNVRAANTYRAQRQQNARVRDRSYAVGNEVVYRGRWTACG